MSNMKKMTKAQLINEVNQLNHRIKELEKKSGVVHAMELTEQLRVKDQRIKNLEEESERRFRQLQGGYDARVEGQAHLDRALDQLEKQRAITADLLKERDDWKDAFLKEKRLKEEARELLVRQAHLAGEVAKLVGMAGLRS